MFHCVVSESANIHVCYYASLQNSIQICKMTIIKQGSRR